MVRAWRVTSRLLGRALGVKPFRYPMSLNRAFQRRSSPGLPPHPQSDSNRYLQALTDPDRSGLASIGGF